MTPFGVAWSQLELEHVEAFLEGADDEPLLWEAKGTKVDKREVRAQVCGFANSHEGGYLILGARRGETGDWVLDGLRVGEEPVTWISDLVTDLERGVRPLPSFEVRAWPAQNGHVAVVQVAPTSTPPCITNGTVYERVPGKTPTVRDPMRLAALFARGDQARRNAEGCAERAARHVLELWLDRPFLGAMEDSNQVDDPVRYAVGLCATGNQPDIAGRLFQASLVEEIWTELRDRPSMLPAGFGTPPEPGHWSQEAMTFRHRRALIVEDVTVVRASWDGAVAVGHALNTAEAYADRFVEGRVAEQWEMARRILRRLQAYGDFYLCLIVTGGTFKQHAGPAGVTLRRGPLRPESIGDHAESLGRELLRAVGGVAPEPPPPHEL
jgi:hypothetical protein